MPEIDDGLSKEVFICMYCQKKFGVEQGTFPQKYIGSDEYNMDADDNNRIGSEFVCYDCLE